MIESNAWVIVPVKSFHGAKRRLSPLLSVSERAKLAWTMLGDVLSAAIDVPGLCNVAVVTSDDEVADFTRQLGVVVIDDQGAVGTNAAVKAGFLDVTRRRGSAVVALPSDVPGVLPADIAALFAAVKKAGVAIAPAPRDGGTNALACDVPGRIAPCFGPESFARHVQAANRSGIRPVVVMNGRLGLDIDEPQHLAELLDSQTQTRTDAYLRSLGLNGRVEWPANWHQAGSAPGPGVFRAGSAPLAVWQ